MSEKRNPLTIPLAKFRTFPPEEQEALRLEAIQDCKQLVQKFLIDGGYCWILVCGFTSVIRAGAQTEDKIESAADIAKFEEAMGFPAYSIYRHEAIPEHYNSAVWVGICAEIGGKLPKLPPAVGPLGAFHGNMRFDRIKIIPGKAEPERVVGFGVLVERFDTREGSEKKEPTVYIPDEAVQLTASLFAEWGIPGDVGVCQTTVCG